MAGTSRISPVSDKIVKELAEETGRSKIEIIEAALVMYRHYERMHRLNADYQRLRSDKRASQEEIEERNIWEGTLTDGFEEE